MSSPFQRSKRWSILPAYTVDGYITYIIHHGSITERIFNDFVRERVLPQYTPYEQERPRSVIVLDNATIHKSDELEEMCEEAGVLLAYLPAYSCDFNPIETSFTFLKSYLRRHNKLADTYTPKDGGFQAFLRDAVQAQRGRQDPRALFRLSHIVS